MYFMQSPPEIIYLKKLQTPPPPLEIEWCPLRVILRHLKLKTALAILALSLLSPPHSVQRLGCLLPSVDNGRLPNPSVGRLPGPL